VGKKVEKEKISFPKVETLLFGSRMFHWRRGEAWSKSLIVQR